MKAIPFVDANGNYVEDIIVDDDFSGVERKDKPGDEDEVIHGFAVSYSVKQGLYKPRLDIKKMESDFGAFDKGLFPDQLTAEQVNVYWIEGLTADEIDEANQPSPLTEFEIFKNEVLASQAEMWDFLLGGRA